MPIKSVGQLLGTLLSPLKLLGRHITHDPQMICSTGSPAVGFVTDSAAALVVRHQETDQSAYNQDQRNAEKMTVMTSPGDVSAAR